MGVGVDGGYFGNISIIGNGILVCQLTNDVCREDEIVFGIDGNIAAFYNIVNGTIDLNKQI